MKKSLPTLTNVYLNCHTPQSNQKFLTFSKSKNKKKTRVEKSPDTSTKKEISTIRITHTNFPHTHPPTQPKQQTMDGYNERLRLNIICRSPNTVNNFTKYSLTVQRKNYVCVGRVGNDKDSVGMFFTQLQS